MASILLYLICFLFYMCWSYQYQCPLYLYMLVSCIIFKYTLGCFHQHLPLQLPPNFQFLNIFLMIQSIQLPYSQSFIFFQRSQWYLIIYVLMANPMRRSITFIQVKRFWINWKGFLPFDNISWIHPFKLVPMKLESPIIPPLISFIYIFLNFILLLLWFFTEFLSL